MMLTPPKFNFCLVGNPNCGKTSIFNSLTGLKQKVSNFPGVTVDKKEGQFKHQNTTISIIDLPGTYSLYPRQEDETITYKYIIQSFLENALDGVLLVADACNLKRNLLLCQQIIDLKIPVILIITMNDLAKNKEIKIDDKKLNQNLGVPVVFVNPRKNKGITELKNFLTAFTPNKNTISTQFPAVSIGGDMVKKLNDLYPNYSSYFCLQLLLNHAKLTLNTNLKSEIERIINHQIIDTSKIQAEETLWRYQNLQTIVQKTVSQPSLKQKKLFSEKLDNILLSKTWGYLILTFVLFVLFQTLFWLAKFPMDFIENGFVYLSYIVQTNLPDTWWRSLLDQGLLAGLSGVIVFIPQIMILFALITIIEDSGYMARISFLMDRLLRKSGLNGKSIMPMISGFACAVPAIIACRNIENKKEKLLTIFVLPLMSCSARIPVYSILINVFITEKTYFGVINLRGIVMMLFYILGIVLALALSYVLKKIIPNKEKSYFILELPIYKLPRFKNMLITMIQKASIFTKDAGKVIVILSLILWFLNTNGPPKPNEALQEKYQLAFLNPTLNKDSLNTMFESEKLQYSFTGILGRFIEPIFKPLGFDWKMDIAIITSFAAREVFVGTMATLYSTSENSKNLEQKLLAATDSQGKKIYTTPTCLSLLVFYAIALQCLSTFVITYKELKSLKLSILQFAVMSFMAYSASWLIYHISSFLI